jgi:hypothetical protein
MFRQVVDSLSDERLEMDLTPEQYAILVNILEMRLQRCQDNNWLAEAEQINVILKLMVKFTNPKEQ